MQPDNTITHWECPRCGRVGASGHPHSPTWSAEFERKPQPCDGEPVRRTYVAVDAVEEALKDVSRNLAGAHVNADVTLANVRLRLRALTDDPSSRNQAP